MNAFALLGFEPRFWLDGDEITRRFHERAASLHPDRDGGDADRFAELNTAYSTIREPETRLRHFLAITYPELATDGPKRLAEADLFMQIGAVLQAANRLRKDMASATTPLRRALLSRESVKCREDVRRMQVAVAEKWRKLIEELQLIDRNWPELPVGMLAALAESLAFLRKWGRQLESAEAELGA